MAYNGTVLARARRSLERRHEENLAEQARRARAVYSRIPRLREIDAGLRRQMAKLAALAFSREADAAAQIDALREANLALQAERAGLLRSAGLPEDYLDEIYSCPRCRDTGRTPEGVCDCLEREYKRCLTQELSGLLRDEGERFANLLCHGGPGLGQTFLAACLAREVAQRGFSVAYESASAALGEFETQRFSRDGEESAAASTKVREYLGCDLMILDDLGTEMSTSFTVSALYQLINLRLTAPRPTIISTNLGEEELARRYGGQIASRLTGEYELLLFAGSDIRRLKKERGL